LRRPVAEQVVVARSAIGRPHLAMTDTVAGVVRAGVRSSAARSAPSGRRRAASPSSKLPPHWSPASSTPFPQRRPSTENIPSSQPVKFTRNRKTPENDVLDGFTTASISLGGHPGSAVGAIRVKAPEPVSMVPVHVCTIAPALITTERSVPVWLTSQVWLLKSTGMSISTCQRPLRSASAAADLG
jgi:hypothetical protein